MIWLTAVHRSLLRLSKTVTLPNFWNGCRCWVKTTNEDFVYARLFTTSEAKRSLKSARARTKAACQLILTLRNSIQKKQRRFSGSWPTLHHMRNNLESGPKHKKTLLSWRLKSWALCPSLKSWNPQRVNILSNGSKSMTRTSSLVASTSPLERCPLLSRIKLLQFQRQCKNSEYKVNSIKLTLQDLTKSLKTYHDKHTLKFKKVVDSRQLTSTRLICLNLAW